MNDIQKNVLEKIKEDHIRPRPKWHFALMHALLWGALIISIALGSLSVAISLRHLFTAPWEMVRLASQFRWHNFIVLLPYLWLVFLGLSTLAASWLLPHTKNGYRIPPLWAAGGSVLCSLLLGGMIYLSHADSPIEDQLQQRLPFYMEMRQGQERILLLPERGLLAGQIVQIQPEMALILMDLQQRLWEVDISQARYGRLEEGMRAGVLGEKTGKATFRAKAIKPLRP